MEQGEHLGPGDLGKLIEDEKVVGWIIGLEDREIVLRDTELHEADLIPLIRLIKAGKVTIVEKDKGITPLLFAGEKR